MVAHRFDLNARVDQMQAMRNGANDDLLNVWVGKIFSTSTSLDEEALATLAALRDHPYLPSYGLTKAVLPSQVVTDIDAARLALSLGFSASNIDPGQMNTVRSLALSRASSLEMHALLTDHGIPVPSLVDVAKASSRIIETLAYESLEYLGTVSLDSLQAMVQDPQANAVLLRVLISKYEELPSRMNRFLDTWETHSSALELAVAPSRKGPAASSLKWLQAYDFQRTKRRAKRLDFSLPTAQEPRGPRPRF